MDVVHTALRRGSPQGPAHRSLTRRWTLAACVSGAIVLTGIAPAAQAQTSAIRGQVVEQGTGHPVLGATVTLVGTTKSATSDSSGHFRYEGLTPGLYVVQVNAIGFSKGIFQLELREGEALSRVFELTPRVYGMDPLTVEAERRSAGRRFDEFRQRMARGVGSFITKEDIERRNPSNLMDMLRTLRGVHAECQGSNCIVRFSGQPTSCEPKYVLDNLPSDSWIVESLNPRDIEGVEVYRGASEMPAEYGGSDAACGAIVVWTKSGPD
jgi:hypothetical protein